MPLGGKGNDPTFAARLEERAARVHRRISRLGLLARFAIASVLPIAALGLVLDINLQSTVRQQAEGDARQFAYTTTGIAVRTLLTASAVQNGLTSSQVALVDVALRAAGGNGLLLAVDLVNSQGTIVYAMDRSLIGRRATSSAQLSQAFRGHVASLVKELTGDDPGAPGVRTRSLVLWLPVHLSGGSPGQVQAVAIAYRPYAPVDAAVSGSELRIDLLLGGGLLVLWLALSRLVLDVSRRQRRQVIENEYMALHDSLTDLPNRTLFADRLSQAILASDRTGVTVAVLLMDIDRFKVVNDTLGHSAGDLLLKQVGPRIRALIRPADTIARLGGDEFGVVLSEVGGHEGATLAASRLVTELQRPAHVANLALSLEASIGVALYPEHGEDGESLLQMADVAMYMAKETQTGYQVYDPHGDASSGDRLTLVSDLRSGIERGELEVYYQPKARLADAIVDGVEALVRWNHPTRGVIAPDSFIPAAESSGLIRPLTADVLDQSVAAVRRWDDQGFHVMVSVNLSARSLLDPEFVDEVMSVLSRHCVDASRLEMEITERTVMVDPRKTISTTLQALREMGITLAMDDFGTGYASLAFLRQLPVNKIKIDKSFVMNISDPSDAVIVRSTIDMGRNLGLQVTAEGVENQEAWNEVFRLGCDEAQGYLLSRPVPEQELLNLFRCWRHDPMDL